MTRNAAVLGSPITHSLSPALHRAAYRALGLDWRYEAFDVGADDLADFVAGLDDTWVGLSLTMPLKEAVLELALEVDPTAQQTRSANTLLLPSRVAYNTDVDGLVVALQRAGFDGEAGFAGTVVGAGATARSAVVALHRLGASHIDILARRPAAATAARETARTVGLDVSVHEFSATEHLANPLVISTVPAGIADALVTALPQRPAVLLDVVYTPWPTEVAAAWQQCGGRIVSGAEMLLAQAERQVELMTGMAAPGDAMRAALPATHA